MRIIQLGLAAMLIVMLALGLVAGSVMAQSVELPPQQIMDAYRAGGVALVFGCYDSGNVNINEWNAELPLIAASGARHVRLTCSMDSLEQGTTGTVNPARLTQVIEFVNRAWSYGLLTTVDVHNTGMREPGHTDWTDNYMWGVGNAAVEARHTSLIVDLLTKVAAQVPHDRFVFQPANEPIAQPTWYAYQQRYFPLLRAACADCTIMVMARDWQGLEETIYRLDTSVFTGPIMVDVHFYEPINMTHCSYPGTANNCPGMQYPGNHTTWRGSMYYDISWFRTHMSQLKNWADQRGVFVNIGEFGTTWDLAHDVQTRYFSDLVTIFRENGWGYTVYEWYRNFGVKHNPEGLQALFSPGVVVTPAPSATATTSLTPVPGVTATVVATVVPNSLDIDELIRLAQEVQAARLSLQTTEQTLQSVQNAYNAALSTVTSAEQELINYLRSIGIG